MGCAAKRIDVEEYGVMPISRPDIEEELRDYLLYEKRNRDSIHNALKTISNQFNLHDQKDDERHTQVMQMFAGVNSRISAIEKSAEDTGSWVVKEKERRKWWKTQAGRIGLKVVEVLITLAIGALFAHLALR